MNLLITNDDGISAQGIAVLARAAAPFGKVTVVAPARQCSAMSHRITLGRPLRLETVDFPVENIRTRILDFLAEETDESLNIADAEVIVCVGNGLKGADALPRYRALAEKLGGKLACSRPVFDRGLLPYKLVVGQSGVVVKPKVYLAFGVSGAINHVTGFSDAGLVVAVNSDPDAPIFNYCDYGLVGDMDEVCEALLNAVIK